MRVLVLTMDASDAAVPAALRIGVRGHLLEEVANDDVTRTTSAVGRGELAVSPERAPGSRKLLSTARQAPAGLEGLTVRETGSGSRSALTAFARDADLR